MLLFGSIFLITFAVSPTLHSVVKNIDHPCSADEFECADGGCVSARLLCDGRASCADGSDETRCDRLARSLDIRGHPKNQSDSHQDFHSRSADPTSETYQPWRLRTHPRSNSEEDENLGTNYAKAYPKFGDHNRYSWSDGATSRRIGRSWTSDGFRGGIRRDKRQNRCSNAQWKCKNGDCIDSDGKCDGVVNCADGSDETHALCRNLDCPQHLFRCTYGACVDGYSKCDNVTNCVDNSDELHPDCLPGSPVVSPGKFRCADGGTISTTQRCDGRADCADGSDETVRACGATRCHSAHLFQCAYGACVDAGSDCDSKQDCADGSDEADDLCNRMGSASPGTVRPTAPPVQTPPTGTGSCVLPPYPEHGRYAVTSNNPSAGPGTRLQSAYITVSCDPGYMLSENRTSLVCVGNSGWSAAMPKCVEYCRLNPHRSVTYNCVVPNTQGGTQICPTRVPTGTTVIPACNTPNYYSRSPVPYMKCLDGQFDYIHICEPGLSQGTLVSVYNIVNKTIIYIDKFNYTANEDGNRDGKNSTNYVRVEISDTDDENNRNVTDDVNISVNDSNSVNVEIGINSTYINIGIKKKNDEKEYKSSKGNESIILNESGNFNYNNYEIGEDDWRMGRGKNKTEKIVLDLNKNLIISEIP